MIVRYTNILTRDCKGRNYIGSLAAIKSVTVFFNCKIISLQMKSSAVANYIQELLKLLQPKLCFNSVDTL